MHKSYYNLTQKLMKKHLTQLFFSALTLVFMLGLSPAYAQHPTGKSNLLRTRLGAFGQGQLTTRVKKPIHPAAGNKANMMEKILSTKDGAEIWGVVQYASTADDSYFQDQGVYSFNAKAPISLKPLMKSSDLELFSGGAIFDGHFHYTSYYAPYPGYANVTLYDYDITTWQDPAYTSIYPQGNIVSTDQAYDPITKKVYAYFYNPDDTTASNQFGTIDYQTGNVSIIKNNEDLLFVALACDNNGQLWGINNYGNLWKIDKTTGQTTLVSVLYGVEPSTFSQSMTFDPNTGKLYWACFRNDHTSGLYVIDTQATKPQAQLVADFPNNEEVACLYIPKQDTQDKAPAGVRNLTVTFNEGSTTGQYAFTMPNETFDGSALSGTLDYYLVANEDTLVRGQATAGATVSGTLTARQGKESFTVVTKNSAGMSPASEPVNLFVGYDTPLFNGPVTLSIDSDNVAHLSWQPATKGMNGGYVDSTNIRYNVTRYPGEQIVATQQADTTFTETLPDEAMKVYSYAVVALNDTMKSEPVTSNKVAGGSAFDIPFSEDFSNDDDFNLFTVLDLGGSGSWNMSWQNVRIYHFSGQSDDWLITPPIKLKKGKTYNVSCVASPGYSSAPDALQILVGQRTDTVGYSEVVPKTAVNKSSQQVGSTFSVAADGDYRLAFRSLGDDNSYGITLDDISVTEVAVKAPAACGVSIEAGSRGAKKATIHVTAPSLNKEGGKLSTISRIVVARKDKSVVETFSNPAPGAQLSATDSKAVNGWNTYYVTAYTGETAGDVATDSAYVGQDKPLQPNNVRLKDNLDGTATLLWDAPDEMGQNGFFVDKDSLTYTVYDQEGNVLKGNINAETRQMTIEDVAQTGFFSLLYAGVSASNIAGTSAVATSNALAVGQSDKLPVTESFANMKQHYPHWWADGTGSFNTPGFDGDMYSDRDRGSFRWEAFDNGETEWLSTAKVSMSGAKQVGVVFSYYVEPGHNRQVTVLAVHPDGITTDTLGMVNDSLETGKARWMQKVLYLSQAQMSEPYLVFRFMMHAQNRLETFYLDNIKIADIPHKDLAAQMSMASGACRGKQAVANVTVANNGSDVAQGYSVNVYMNNDCVATLDNGSKLAALSDTTVRMAFDVPMNSADSSSVYAVVTLSGDENDVNNCSDTTLLKLENSSYPTATGLTAQAKGNGAELSWQAPERANCQVTEDFETAQPWLTNGVNGFTTVDGDTTKTNTWTAMWYEHMGEPFAWLLFNDQQALMDVSQQSCFAAHSGHQMMTTVSTVHDYMDPTAVSDDWLISPQLSGEAQTVSFYVKCIGSYEEDFDVWYSTEDADTASLKKHKLEFVKFTPLAWTRYSYDLPAGTKYFAIHWMSNLTGIGVDDVTYEGTTLTLTGYNIYRDGRLLATVPAGTTHYTDNNLGEDGHIYHVSALYKEGESGWSNAATVVTGIENITLQAGPADVYNLSGILVKHNATTLEGLPHGVYIVRGHKVVK